MKSYLWWIALRQVFFPEKKAGLLFMSIASMLGVVIGIVALMVTLSVMGGFEKDLRSKIFSGLSHIQVLSQPARLGWSLKEHPLAYFSKHLPQAEAISAFIRADIIIKNKDRIASATVLGLDPRSSADIWGIKKEVSSFKSFQELMFSVEGEDPALVMGDQLARRLGAFTGSTVYVLASKASLSGFLHGDKLFQPYRVAGIFHKSKDEYNARYVVTSLKNARRYMDDYDVFLDEEEYVSGVAAVFSDPDMVDEVNDQTFPDKFTALSWKQENRSLLMALILEKFAMGTVLFLIIVVAVFSLSGAVMMTVYYKRSQISLLRGLGMPWQDVVKIFVAHGMIIGLIGVVVGAVGGLLLCILIKSGVLNGLLTLFRHGGIGFHRLPVEFLYKDYAIICLSALVLIILASVYPAYLAGKQHPGKGLRY
ncbi:MAG: ABC transporter permease [Proteobacteria bacterium]|nr:ABC transporter permease [Pseudomonadota bacterium]